MTSRARSGPASPATGAGSAIIYARAGARRSALGLGALVIVLTDTDDTTQVVSQAWSEFHPGRLAERARERDRGARHERLPGARTGSSWSEAIAGPPVVVSNQPEGSTQVLIRAVAIQPDIPTAARSRNREIEVIDTSSAVQYVLCGWGDQCAIASGQPSEARHLLLRREALELALHTFKNSAG